MAGFPTVRVAAVQATPVVLDAEATVDKAVGLLGRGGRAGRAARRAARDVRLASTRPTRGRATRPRSAAGTSCGSGCGTASVDVGGPHVARLVEACREHDLHCVIGVNEREDERPGTLYNTMLTLGPAGVLHRHRKLMPTMQERLFHGVGAGDDLGVVDARRASAASAA